ncbi:NACHT domain-containing protein [Chitinophaga sp. S165]|uniref:NACHT domain-containing protein n=1 Tax=Chitinophaga sp. S165 TaxID=2135462 RepID=UPI000D71AF6F|nr:NACHT domain-containing protein [Chitinophaga sp. S165]PWV49681.1 AAA ATPase-like protein [Chitinophaga sp. S165]
MNNSIYQRPLFYQSANADDEAIKANFLIRLAEYDIIIQDILRNPMKGSVQHYLLIGRRGSGKSTLLKRLQVEIASNPLLKGKYIPINLAEEQANIYKLYDLLEEIIRELAQHGISKKEPVFNDDIHVYSRQLFDHIHLLVTKSGKKIVLLLDNVDRIFENIGEDASLLREYLLNHDDIRIIGGSTRMTEHFWKYNQPFYQFFRVLELKALTAEEVRTLLLSWSEKQNIPQLRSFIETRPGQLEAIRLLTDGLPRTLQFFVNILLTNTQDTGYEYLRHVMDSVTPLYQERLNTLPSSQKKIVLQMAFIWEATGTGKLAEATKMNNNVISAQLKQLSEKGIVEKVETGTKNHLYRLAERFFNLWLIFTQGSPADKRRAKYLTIFLENFYNAEQIQLLAKEHLDALDKGAIPPSKAVLLTKAFVQSNCIKSTLREQLITKTLQLTDIDDDIKKHLPPTLEHIMDSILSLVENGKFMEALQLAAEIEYEGGIREFIQGYIYLIEGNSEEGEKVLLASIKNGFPSHHMLASLHLRHNNVTAAEKMFLEALSQDSNIQIPEQESAYSEDDKYTLLLKAHFVEEIERNSELAKSIATIYAANSEFEEAEFFLRLGIKKGVKSAAHDLALILYQQNINKQEALQLVAENYEDYKDDIDFQTVSIIVNAWCGNLQHLHREVYDFVKAYPNDSWAILERLLCHGQSNLVYQIFHSSETADALRERYLPIYYACLLLTQNKENIHLRIPPEIASTVNEIIQEVTLSIEYYKEN